MSQAQRSPSTTLPLWTDPLRYAGPGGWPYARRRSPVAVVAGARGTAGRRIARTLVADGYALALTERLSAVHGRGGGAVALAGEAAPHLVADLPGLVVARFGGVDVLVNLLTPVMPSAAHGAVEHWRRAAHADLALSFQLCRAFGGAMIRSGHGSIVNVVSIERPSDARDWMAYATICFRLTRLSRTLAVQWGCRGVRVNTVCRAWPVAAGAAAGAGGASTAAYPAGHQLIAPADTASTVAYLAEPARSAGVNGRTLVVLHERPAVPVARRRPRFPTDAT